MSRPRRSPRSPDGIDIGRLVPPFAPANAAEEWLFRLQRLGIRPGLEAIGELLAGMGHPERTFRCVVVAGTNGKGSAAHALEAYCRSAGLRTGLYTSPHLLGIRERLRVDGEKIPEDALFGLVAAHRGRMDVVRATFFESLTALALDWFARQHVDVAILEAGLGGRLDATNAVPKAGAVLTSIGLDHQELLGNSHEAILLEKLGLAARAVPFYLGDLEPSLRQIALRRLRDEGAEALEIEDLVGASSPTVRDPRLQGAIQRSQFARLACVYDDLARRAGWPRSKPARALDLLHLRGRYDVVAEAPRLVLDTAHNAHALGAVFGQFRGEASRQDRVLVFAAMQDKEIESVVPDLIETAGTVLVTAPRWMRALAPETLAAKLREVAAARGADLCIEIPGTVRATLERAREIASTRPEGRVLVTGSNFLVAEALDRLGYDDLDLSPEEDLWSSRRPLRCRVPAQTAEAGS